MALVIPINLDVIGVEICVKYASCVKLVQVRTKVFPELNIARCLCDSLRQGADSCHAHRQEIGAVYRSGARVARRRRVRNR